MVEIQMCTSVAVVIPCRNEEAYIGNCIQSVLNSNYPIDRINIYVCDGLSDDRTLAIVSEFSISNDNVHYLKNELKTTPYALNLGLKAGDEDVKIILGAHSEVDPNFIIENIKILNKNDEIMCSGGVLENVYENKAANIVGIAMSSPFGVGNAHFRTGAKDGIVDTVAFGAYKKSVFTTIGYFDEDLARNQDDEFNYRLLQSGGKIYLSKKIKCKYFVRSSYLKLFNQYYQYGFWKVFVGKKHGAITTVRQLIPMLFVVFNILIILTLLISSKLAITMLLGDVVYLLGAFYFALKTKEVLLLPQIIYTFLILHISYGFGYLMGVFNFLLLSRSPDQKTKLTR